MACLRGLTMEVLALDEDVVVVNKPSGMLVHRGWGDDRVTAMDWVRDHVGARVNPVHRLDRGTSGALVFARNEDATRALSASFAQGQIEKRYVALVRGLAPKNAHIDHAVPRGESGVDDQVRVGAVTDVARLATIG